MQSNFATDGVEESVDVLLAKLKAKGKKVRLGDDPTSTVHQMEEIEKIVEEKEKMNEELNQKHQMLEAE